MSLIDTLLKYKKSDTVFIIGGGNSINKYLPDASILANKDIISCNVAYKLFPNSIKIFLDEKFFHQFKEDLIKLPAPLVSSNIKKLPHYIDNNVMCFLKAHKGIISKDDNMLYGANTGHAAVNLAYLMGYKKIVLLGFDLNCADTKTHYHNEYKTPTNIDRYRKNFIPDFMKLAEMEKELGINIYNINKESALKCFKFAELSEFL